MEETNSSICDNENCFQIKKVKFVLKNRFIDEYLTPGIKK